MQTTLMLPSDESLSLAADLITQGEIVGFPTETVYGLGANALDADAVNKIFKAKGRPQDNPLIVHICNADELSIYGCDISKKTLDLVHAFWPGPLTVVVKKAEIIADNVTCGLDTVGIRCPENDIARKLIAYTKKPIAAPSANRSGRPSPTTAQHVFDDMNGRIPLIIDGGESTVGVESTVISMVGEKPMILRPGIISREEIEAVIGPVDISPSIEKQLDETSTVQSPGMKYRHYAPNCPMYLVAGESEVVYAYINQNLTESCAVLCFDGEESLFHCGRIISLGDKDNAASLSHNLFAALRQCNDAGVLKIYAHLCRKDGAFLGVYNRMLKASGFQLIEL